MFCRKNSTKNSNKFYIFQYIIDYYFIKRKVRTYELNFCFLLLAFFSII